jgi:hypothetical protein
MYMEETGRRRSFLVDNLVFTCLFNDLGYCKGVEQRIVLSMTVCG